MGIAEADHAESNPEAEALVISALTCSLAAEAGDIILAADSKIRAIYQAAQIREIFNCNYGLNPSYAAMLQGQGVYFSGHGEDGEVRVIELQTHPFFIATLYQPERSALTGHTDPLITAFIRAAGRTIS